MTFAFTLFLSGAVLAAPLLKLGSEGHDVRILQENLSRLGYDVELSEIFDDATQRAVLEFQRAEGLTASGAVDRETWRALKTRAASKPSAAGKTEQPEKETPSTQSAPDAKPAAKTPPANPTGKTPTAKPSDKTPTAKPSDKTPEPATEKVPESAPFLPKKKVDSVIKTAKKYTGTRYVFGGTTPKGFDCSGFVQYVFKQNGFAIPRTADEQYKLGKRIKKRAELEPGDLVFFSTYEKGASHCGIYLGKNQFIHVSSSKGVRVDSLDDSYWKPRWYGGKHIVKK
ncbi:MAG: C40 family peptidase [Schwartzia sp.]|nr:C40 family peptidase [Schwartzia sp. (in: firmicutes)]